MDSATAHALLDRSDMDSTTNKRGRSSEPAELSGSGLQLVRRVKGKRCMGSISVWDSYYSHLMCIRVSSGFLYPARYSHLLMLDTLYALVYMHNAFDLENDF